MGRVPFDSLPIEAPGIGAEVTTTWRNPDWTTVEGTDVPWLYTSALVGPLKLQIRLAPESSPSREYHVTLFFHDPNGTADSARFDVKLQGETALSAIDVRQKTGGLHAPMIKELTIKAADQLTLELLPRNGRAPIISAMQIGETGTKPPLE
jgi:hypothetical protein